MFQKIPLTTRHNQELTTTIQLSGNNVRFKFNLNYNKVASYWILKITDPSDESITVDSIPLVSGSGEIENLNILRKLGYLSIGNAYLVPIISKLKSDFPNDTNLESEFELSWDDND